MDFNVTPSRYAGGKVLITADRKGGYCPPLLLLPVVAGYIVNFVLSAHPPGGKRA
jgi:hypothetical protein